MRTENNNDVCALEQIVQPRRGQGRHLSPSYYCRRRSSISVPSTILLPGGRCFHFSTLACPSFFRLAPALFESHSPFAQPSAVRPESPPTDGEAHYLDRTVSILLNRCGPKALARVRWLHRVSLSGSE